MSRAFGSRAVEDGAGEEFHVLYSPNMDETFALFVGRQGWDTDLTKDDGSVASLSRTDFNQVIADGEVNKLGVRDLGGTGPHPRIRVIGKRQVAHPLAFILLTSVRVYPTYVGCW